MISKLFRKIATNLPVVLQQEIKRYNYMVKIKKNKFYTDEPEYQILNSLLSVGDWVVDIGANVGHYTKRFSELVGEAGRVIALEPVPATFSLLAANVQLFKYSNVSLFNIALSDIYGIVGMNIPLYDDGIINYYEAHLIEGEAALHVLTLPLDCLLLSNRIALIKIDAEGHEISVLNGMRSLLERDLPTLIIETNSIKVLEFLEAFGYKSKRLPNSPNQIFMPTHYCPVNN